MRASADGESRVTPQGHVRLPALVRHRCDLNTGDRILLVADPTSATLRVVPPAMLDRRLSSVDEGAYAGPRCADDPR
jgi:bifunctional DNA-binding transcriptional regulator/antitoxin component of YhaV-PrlF toxin-antitoxin module